MTGNLVSRKGAREELAAVIGTGIPQLTAVYGYAPKDPQGISPFCTVESWRHHYQFHPAIENKFGFLVKIWVKREDAETAEEQLDDLALDLAVVIRRWHNVHFATPSETGYEQVDNDSYRTEIHYVEVDYDEPE